MTDFLASQASIASTISPISQSRLVTPVPSTICAGGHFRGDHTAFLDIFVANFFIQNHDVRKRPDNQPLWLSAAGGGTRAALRASRFALRRCRSAFSACFRRSVCRDIRAPVSGIVSREESYAQGLKRPHGARSYTSASELIPS